MTLTCKKCHKNYKTLAGDLCFFCDINHWFAFWNKQYMPKK